MFGLAAQEAAQSAAVLQRHIRNRPGKIRTESPEGTDAKRLLAHLAGGIVQPGVDFLDGGARADPRQVGTIAAAAALDHVTAAAAAFAEEESFARRDLLRRRIAQRRVIHRLQPGGDARHLFLRQAGEGRHAARHAAPDDGSDAARIQPAQVGIVGQRRGAVTTAAARAVADGAVLLEIILGRSEGLLRNGA